MKLNELKKEIDKLVQEGYGEYELKATEPNDSNSLWNVLSIGFEEVFDIDTECYELKTKDVLTLYIGDDE